MKDLTYLVVDDMMTMRKIICAQLKNNGITTYYEANDGSTALESLKVNHIDVIISDWNMPEVKGVDLLRAVRKNPAWKNMGFLMVTAESEINQVKEAVEAGVDNYVVKPFTPAAFLEKLQAVVRKRFPKSV